METFSNPKIEESIKELAFQLFKEEILYKLNGVGYALF